MLLLLLACTGPSPSPDPIDLTARLGPGEARVGRVTDEAALFGGVSAEGRAGDFKIYNDRVQFVIQGPRAGDFYFQQAGGVIDADVVRPEGEPGRDLVDEWMGMYGLARFQDATRFTILDSGEGSDRAAIRVDGPESPMALATGALEYPGLVPDLGLHMSTLYVLEADSNLLRVITTITAGSQAATLEPGDILMGSLDAAWRYTPGFGLEAPEASELAWTGFIGQNNQSALGIFPEAGQTLHLGAGAELLASIAEAALGFVEPVTIEPGESFTFSRYYGVGADPDALTAEWMDRSSLRTRLEEGVVTAPDGPVAGAWVHALVDGEPFTMGLTDAEGRFSITVPAEAVVTLRAVGRGDGVHADLPEGAPRISPYAAPPVQAAALDALANGAPGPAVAHGRGAATAADPLTLGQPGEVVVRSADGLPFEALLAFAGAAPTLDPRLEPRRPDGYAALGWGRDGELRLPVEPGDYSLLVHRGLRWEVHQQSVSVTAGEATEVEVDLEAAYAPTDWLIGDPHSHASPSNDASCPMEERLVVAAGVGVGLHFGTDHDHVADYSVLIGPLGLDGVLSSVVADEVSPPLRGHVNAYPLETVREQPNNGAWLWWNRVVSSTQEQFDGLRAQHEGVVLQLNHPTDSGVANSADWTPGRIGDGDRWTEDYDAIEVINSGDYEEFFAFWMDTLNRGVLSTPVGVSDSHGHRSGRPGMNVTFLHMSSDPAAYTPAALREAMRSRATIASLGPFLDMSITPGSVVAPGQTLEVQALSPSWITVDRLVLYVNGERADVVEDSAASWLLDPAQDASYVVVAEGDGDMAPVWPGKRPWAVSSAILVDVAGDGWEAPLEPLVVN